MHNKWSTAPLTLNDFVTVGNDPMVAILWDDGMSLPPLGIVVDGPDDHGFITILDQRNLLVRLATTETPPGASAPPGWHDDDDTEHVE